jgi:hypothetical protein
MISICYSSAVSGGNVGIVTDFRNQDFFDMLHPKPGASECVCFFLCLEQAISLERFISVSF